MKRISSTQKKLIAEFLSNIGVAWFAGGVVSIFLSRGESVLESLISILWGLILSGVFLWLGINTLKGVKR